MITEHRTAVKKKKKKVTLVLKGKVPLIHSCSYETIPSRSCCSMIAAAETLQYLWVIWAEYVRTQWGLQEGNIVLTVHIWLNYIFQSHFSLQCDSVLSHTYLMEFSVIIEGRPQLYFDSSERLFIVNKWHHVWKADCYCFRLVSDWKDWIHPPYFLNSAHCLLSLKRLEKILRKLLGHITSVKFLWRIFCDIMRHLPFDIWSFWSNMYSLYQ